MATLRDPRVAMALFSRLNLRRFRFLYMLLNLVLLEFSLPVPVWVLTDFFPLYSC